MSVFSSGKRSSVSKKSSLTNNSTRSSLSGNSTRSSLPSGRVVNTEKHKAVRFELLKNLDVTSVLQKVYKEQEQKDYDTLIRIIQDSEFVVQDAELLKLLTAAKDSIPYLNEKLRVFVQVLLVFQWCTRGPDVVAAYKAFILELCKEQPFYTGLVVEQLVVSFTKVSEPDKINQWLNGFPPDTDRSSFSHIHSLLISLLSASLISTDLFMEKAWSFYPHHNLPCAFLSYTHNLLELTSHACLDPCRKQVFNLVIQKLIHLDTLATKEEIDKAESDHEENLLSSAEIFNMDEDAGMTASGGGPSETLVMHHTVANLLDLCLMRFFKYIQSVCFDTSRPPTSPYSTDVANNSSSTFLSPANCSSKGSSKSNKLKSPSSTSSLDPVPTSPGGLPLSPAPHAIDWDRTRVLFNELLAVFESTILPTHGLTHVPFLVFYFCSFRLNVAENFVEFLWKKITNRKVYNIFRSSCCLYVSSLLIHGHFIPVRVIKTCLNEMSVWLHSYLDSLDLTDEESCSRLKHPVFYSVCQTLFSVITHKHLILVDTKKNMKFLQSLNLSRLVLSPLNPLRSLHPSLVSAFASVTRTYQIVYCYNVIHSNARLDALPIVTVDQEGNITKLNTVQALDMYSPFASFLLIRCKSIITPSIHCQGDPIPTLSSPSRQSNYQEFQQVPIDGNKTNNNDEDDFLMSVDGACMSLSVNMSVSA
uniref:RNA polymerase I-specific transcription initiation factor RRN3 n=1 Tax=Cacopsylla melanoneura TaxID=428564 RepID=A0A8D8LKQ9_9HEMI